MKEIIMIPISLFSLIWVDIMIKERCENSEIIYIKKLFIWIFLSNSDLQ